ncbi:MAG: dihydrolipoamide acetyltransferase family protein [Lentisphaeria bacterium]|nr:dihydrolipoamide acetyltransferase family protein [Lentisphaeria bacterium]
MKTTPILMPQMGQSIAEGTVIKWHCQVGDEVTADELIVDVESDKVSFEVGSPVAGKIIDCLVSEGERAEVGSVIGHIESEDDGCPEAKDAEERTTAKKRRHQPARSNRAPINTDDLPRMTRDWLSPSVARMAVLNNVTVAELGTIRGSGASHRISRQDLMAYLARRDIPGGAASLSPSATADEKQLASLGRVVPMTSIRRTIADHMVQSIHTSAHVTMVHAVDTTHIVALRNKIKDAFLKKHGVKMTYTGVMLYATAQVLKEFPHINASVIGNNIVLRDDISLGCAVALDDQSLVVPVVKNADTKTFAEITCELDRLIKLARGQNLARADVDGGTFTISNFGSFGSLFGTPIINQPQVAILGMGAITKTFVPVDNQPVIRDLLYLSLSFDHRVIDGALGGRFLNRLQETVESLTAAAMGVDGL